jgi:uncharacterized protein YyaL (SSP411 family)
MATGDGRLHHAWRLGRGTAAGLLDDHAAMARAALSLFEATGDGRYLRRAVRLVEAAEAWFADADGSYFTTAADAADVPLGPDARPRTPGDNATPAGNGLMAEVLARLFHLTGDPTWRDRAARVLAAFSGLGERLSACPTLLAAADLLEGGSLVVITGVPGGDPFRALLATALAAADPAVCVLRGTGAPDLPPDHPAHGKPVPAEGAVAYVCRAQVCGLPIDGADRLAAVLAARGRPAPRSAVVTPEA